VDLTGHHSNPSTHLKALLDGVLGALNELDRDERRSERRNIKQLESPVGHRHRRHWVQTAVIAVLERRREPMQASDVHAAVEALLSEPVRWGSVKACLAAKRGWLVASVCTGCAWALRHGHLAPPPLSLLHESGRK
jgi:hypothetical protein